MSTFSSATSSILVGITTILGLSIVIPLYKNIRIARSTGLHYRVVPWYSYNRLVSVFSNRILLALLESWFPDPAPTSWRRLVTSAWPWRLGYAPFRDLGTDTFLTVAPGGIILQTADAAVINQITSRGGDFPKATHLYTSVDIYGKNVVSSEGAVWRRHRKLTAPSFNERCNQLVWRETLDQSREMLAKWAGMKGGVKCVDGDTKILSLNVISRAGLGRKMEWPKEDEKNVVEEDGVESKHRMSFTYSLHYLLRHLLYVMMFPRWFLRISPFAKLRKSFEAYDEWAKYMNDMVMAKKSALHSGLRDTSTTDLIGQLVKGQEETTDEKGTTLLTDSELLGNLFVIILAGHETSASSIHFCLLLLALHPRIQQSVQQDLSRIFGSRAVSDWDYEHDLPRLLNSLLSAVLSEELRIIPPTVTVPKFTGHGPQSLQVEGKTVTIPGNTMIRLCIPSVHRNPKFWPTNPPSPHDLEAFNPARWLPTTAGDPLLTPPRGSYIPFSDGQRACLGRRFAQVEILACLASILSTHSVELAVECSDEQVKAMSEREKEDLWRGARKRAAEVLRGQMRLVITLQLRPGKWVGLRFVRRGEERFFGVQ